MADQRRIPKGWRRLRTGTKVREVDKLWSSSKGRWIRLGDFTADPVLRDEVIIRRIA